MRANIDYNFANCQLTIESKVFSHSNDIFLSIFDDIYLVKLSQLCNLHK